MAHLTYDESVKTVWKTTAILSFVTVVEVVGVLAYPEGWSDYIIRFFVISMSLLKAFYIVGVFMHLKYEVKNLILTVLIPVTILFWAIATFLWEGWWWLHSRESWATDWTYW